MKSLLIKKVLALIILLSFASIHKINGLLTNTKDKQISNNEMSVEFIQLPISVNNVGLKSDLQINMLIFQPYSLKVINPLIQTTTFIKFEDLIIFNNFEVNFDINVQMKPIFGIADSDKNMNVRIILQDMQNKFKHNWQTCRILFSTDSIKNKMMGPASNNVMLSKCSESPQTVYYSIMFMNIFCFKTINHTFIFDSSFSKNYEIFLFSIPLNTVRLYYYNIQNEIYKIIFFLNINNTNPMPFTNSDENFMSNQMGMANAFKYAFLAFSRDGVILSDSPYSITTSVLLSFLYEDIRDCLIETIDKKILFPAENQSPELNKCCIRMQVMQKDLSITSLILCSYTLNEYRCNLEINYIQNKIYDKCPCKFIQNISYAFDNSLNINQIILNFSFLSQGYIYTKIYEFMVNQITFFKSYPAEKQMFIENKLIKMIQELGPSFKNFAGSIENENVLRLLSRFQVEGQPPNVYGGSIMGTNIIPPHSFTQISTINQENLFCNPNIYQLCETHPRMRDCICAAFPLSQICVENYCYLHPNYYECSPAYCLQNSADLEACKCKYNPFDTECKCKLNPLRKQCHCLKYPNSVYCLPGFCQNDSNNMMEIYCVCQNNQNAPECRPEYCHENKYDSRCKCLVNPDDKTCKCMTYPNDPACRMNNNNNNYTNKLNSRDLENLKLDPNQDIGQDFESEQNDSIIVADDSGSGSNSRNNQNEMSKNSRKKPNMNNINIQPAYNKNNSSPSQGTIISNNRRNRKIPNGTVVPSINQNKPYQKGGIIVPNSNDESNNSPNIMPTNGKNTNKIIVVNNKKVNNVKSNTNSNFSLPNPNKINDNKTPGLIPIDDENNSVEQIDPNYQNNQNTQRESKCPNDDTFCICREHPYYSKCVCLAHPTAEICNTSFCSDENNKFSYECNPLQNCLNPSDLGNDECKCKQNFTEECRCKLDPLSKDCFCLKYPDSYLCNTTNCAEDKESIYCKCNNTSTDKECLPTFCLISPNSAECICITNPSNNYCKCLNIPGECNEQEINDSIIQYKAIFSSNNQTDEASAVSKDKTNSGIIQKNSNINPAPKGLIISGQNIIPDGTQRTKVNSNPFQINMPNVQAHPSLRAAPVINAPIISEDPNENIQINQKINNNINQGSSNGLIIPKQDNQVIDQKFNNGNNINVNQNNANKNKVNGLSPPPIDYQQANNPINNPVNINENINQNSSNDNTTPSYLQPNPNMSDQSKTSTNKQVDIPSNNKRKNSPSSNQSYSNPISQKIDLSEEDKHITTLYVNLMKFNNEMKSKLKELNL